MSTAPPSISPLLPMPSLTNVEVVWCVSHHSRAVNLCLIGRRTMVSVRHHYGDFWCVGVYCFTVTARLLLSTPPQTHNYQWINVLVNKLLWMWYRGVKWPFSQARQWRFRAIFDDDKSICSYWVYYGSRDTSNTLLDWWGCGAYFWVCVDRAWGRERYHYLRSAVYVKILCQWLTVVKRTNNYSSDTIN